MRGAAVALTAAILSFLCYAPTLQGGFVSDDALLIAGNPAVRSFARALDAFGRSYWHGLKDVAPYYRPLVLLSYAADHAVAGLNPAVFHATNITLHAGCAILAGLLVTGLAARAPGAGCGNGTTAGAILTAALVAVHPLHSEPAAAIYGRPDLLAAFFSLAFLNLAIRGRPRMALVCLAAALLSKESALGMPLLAPFAFAIGRRVAGPGTPARARRGAVVFTMACLAVLGGYLALRYQALGGWFDERAVTQLDNPLVRGTTLERRLTPVVVTGRYASLWVWPKDLCADRGFDTVPIVSSTSDAGFLGGAALLFAAAALFAALVLRRSVWALPAAAAGLTFVPASNLIVLAPALMAERFAYLPSIFVCILAGAAYAYHRHPR